MHYIYKITNCVNNKIYIGKTSRTIPARFQEHVRKSKGEYSNRPLYDAFKKYGIENFTVEEVESLNTKEEAYEREIYWIHYYDSYKKGYNATLGGEGSMKITIPDETVVNLYLQMNNLKKVSKKLQIGEKTVRDILDRNNVERVRYTKTNKEILMISGNKILKKFKTQADANRYLNKDLHDRGVYAVLTNRQKTAFGYEWRYAS